MCVWHVNPDTRRNMNPQYGTLTVWFPAKHGVRMTIVITVITPFQIVSPAIRPIAVFVIDLGKMVRIRYECLSNKAVDKVHFFHPVTAQPALKVAVTSTPQLQPSASMVTKHLAIIRNVV